MEESATLARVARLDTVEPIVVAGGLYLPLRRLLGVRAFGINAYSARAAGDQLIERHNEFGEGSGHQEEAYIVVTGHARFTVDEQTIDAPAGAIVFVPDIASTRSAVAVASTTTVIVVGGPTDRPLPVSPFEYWFCAEPAYRQGNYLAAIEIAAEGLQQWPDHPLIHYNLACYHALAGHRDQALHDLAYAVTDERTKEYAKSDSDLDSIRHHPRFDALTS